MAPGTGSSCEPDEARGPSFVQRTLCTLSVAGDRVTWPLPTAAVRARRAVKWLERYGEAHCPSTHAAGRLRRVLGRFMMRPVHRRTRTPKPSGERRRP